MSPPAIARALLLAVAGPEESEFVAGDLQEEFALVCAVRGRSAGARWYWRQVVQSAMPLCSLRARSGELTQIMLASVAGVALPLLLLDRLWCFVYSQIPLKDGPERAAGLLVSNLICVCLGAAIGGSTARTRQTAIAIAVAGLGAAAIAISVGAGGAPVPYAIAVLFSAPASSWLTFKWRRSK